MKYSTFIPAVLISLTSVNALAGGYDCKTITGTIEQLSPDEDCKILKSKNNDFPDVTFYVELGAPAEDTCFSAKLTATLGPQNTPVKGIAYSALTVNGIDQLTAASAIRLIAGPIEIGKVNTQDAIYDSGTPEFTKELLTMVSGDKMFKDGHGHLEITGNAFYGDTQFTGKLCIKK
jgi:hypothetical protein